LQTPRLDLLAFGPGAQVFRIAVYAIRELFLDSSPKIIQAI
jgi:hypothetical protein